MKRMKMFLLFALPVLIVVLAVLTFRPIVDPQKDECSLLQGKLAKVESDPETKDVYLRLEGVDRHLYINRALEKGLAEDRLQKLVGENVSLYVVNHWTLLNPNGETGHVSQVEHAKEIVYTEFR